MSEEYHKEIISKLDKQLKLSENILEILKARSESSDKKHITSTQGSVV